MHYSNLIFYCLVNELVSRCCTQKNKMSNNMKIFSLIIFFSTAATLHWGEIHSQHQPAIIYLLCNDTFQFRMHILTQPMLANPSTPYNIFPRIRFSHILSTTLTYNNQIIIIDSVMSGYGPVLHC